MPAGPGKRNLEVRSQMQNMIVEEDENENSQGDLRERMKKRTVKAEDEYEDVF